MQTYCLGCRKHTNNIYSKKVIMRNKVIRDKSRCANCMSHKSRFLKQRFNKKSSWDNINPQIFHTLVIIKHVEILFKVHKKCRECEFKSFKNEKW